MKERSILFNGSMVRAILEGRKTQTRRVVEPQPIDGYRLAQRRNLAGNLVWYSTNGRYGVMENRRCPYGVPGDLLWVRETWCPVDHTAFKGGRLWVDYRATPKYDAPHPAGWDNEPDNPDALKWRPSIHMPRWASRITLRVTNIRVERVQEISEEDALEEGILIEEIDDCNTTTARFGEHGRDYAQEAFRDLWDSINEARGYGWDVNPWVWVVEFERIRP